MKIRQIILAAALVAGSFCAKNTYANEIITTVCDWCSTYSDYRNRARAVTNHLFEGTFQVEVINTTSREVWDFEVYREREPNNRWIVAASGSLAAQEKQYALAWILDVAVPNSSVAENFGLASDFIVDTRPPAGGGYGYFNDFQSARIAPEQVCAAIIGDANGAAQIAQVASVGHMGRIMRNIGAFLGIIDPLTATVIVNNGDYFNVTIGSVSQGVSSCTPVPGSGRNANGDILPDGSETGGGGGGTGGTGGYIGGSGGLTYWIHAGGTRTCATWPDGYTACRVDWDDE